MSGAFRAVSEAPTGGGDEAWGRSLGDDMGGGGVGVVAIWLLTRRGGKADRAEGTEMAGGRKEEITLEGQHAPLLPSGKQRRPVRVH